MTSELFTRRILLAAGSVTIAVAFFLTGFWAGSARGGLEGFRTKSALSGVPAWFGPIWDYYDRNPAVTPEFDFAALYTGEPSGPGAFRR